MQSGDLEPDTVASIMGLTKRYFMLPLFAITGKVLSNLQNFSIIKYTGVCYHLLQNFNTPLHIYADQYGNQERL